MGHFQKPIKDQEVNTLKLHIASSRLPVLLLLKEIEKKIDLSRPNSYSIAVMICSSSVSLTSRHKVFSYRMVNGDLKNPFYS